MQVKSKTYTAEPIGRSTLYIPELAYRDIICVKREGLDYDIITSGAPGNRQVKYINSSGGFNFNTTFMGGYATSVGAVGLSPLEKIYIIWKE